MLDMGFIPDIERICKMIPFTRQTLFFTATMPPEIARITETFLHNPAKIEVSRPATTASGVAQFQVAVGREPHEKRETLRRLLRDAKDLQNAIIFCNRKREVALLYKSLQKHGFAVGALHGDMDQSARTAALDQFRKGEIPLLVASDVAARGLDIPAVSHIFNFDVPHHADDYVHRIGRTGRAGRTGTAISIVAPLDQKSIVAIEKLIGQTIPRAEGGVEVQAADTIAAASGETERPRHSRGRQGSRDGAKDGAKEGSRGGRKPRREREPRRSGGGRNSTPQPQPSAAAFTPPSAPAASRAPSIGRPPAPQAQPESSSEPADHSHLPAFLLRPVRARV
jgi:superfamily II DNA/RNA helicase